MGRSPDIDTGLIDAQYAAADSDSMDSVIAPASMPLPPLTLVVPGDPGRFVMTW